MASAGVTLKKVLRFQVQQAFSQANLDPELIEQEINARERLMDAILDSEGVTEAKNHYGQQFATIQQAMGVDSARANMIAQQQATQLAATFQSAQMQSLIVHDPTDDLRTLDIPTLVLFGGKDTQVTVDMNKSSIEKALQSAGVSYQTKVFPEANHLFQKANTGSVQEYSTLESTFVDELIPTLIEWIKD